MCGCGPVWASKDTAPALAGPWWQVQAGQWNASIGLRLREKDAGRREAGA